MRSYRTQGLIRRLRISSAVALLMLLAACGTPLATPGGAGIDFSVRTILATATTGQVADVVRNVGGERVVVTALMGPGVDPHLYKASAGDVITLQRTDVVFYSGLHLEGRMIEIFERLARTKPVYAITDQIPEDKLRRPPEFEGAFDPHVWFDPTLWATTADVVAERLAVLDPQSAGRYRTNAAIYKQRLAEMDGYARQQLGAIPEESRVLITAHDAFGYFGEHYGIEVRGLQGISTASEAGGADVQRLAEYIAERNVRALFIESSVPQATIEAVQAAVRAKGKDVTIGGQLFSDALGAADSPEGTYLGMFKYNVDTITQALAPQG
jgi:manganese/zinc/iron transport system substrate-binding protein